MQRVNVTAIAMGLGSLLLFPILCLAGKQHQDDFDHPAIDYLKRPATDAVTRLQKQIDAGQVHLTYNARNGYLSSVLAQLKIPVSSQMLVFSKTSFQRDLITPNSPRALYFNDNTYVGWVQDGSVVEVATQDPQLGAVFYTLTQTAAGRPQFQRQSYECLQCHSGGMTAGVPGHIMRSVYTHIDGQPEFRAGTYLTTDQSPLSERWGGWYVTGKHGTMRHMGNVFAKGEENVILDREKGANRVTLKGLVDTAPYIVPTSDIVALLVAEHQTSVQTLLTKANYYSRMALYDEARLNAELKRPADYHSDSTQSRIRSVCEPLLKAMLFVQEAPLTDAVTGTSGYAEQFAVQGPFDHQYRSLRQLDLHRRLLRYPCSYLIYSEAFNALPVEAKTYLYRRLHAILTAADPGKDFAHLSPSDRKAILEILTDTKPDFAALEKAAPSAPAAPASR
jgi:hypothetical protein